MERIHKEKVHQVLRGLSRAEKEDAPRASRTALATRIRLVEFFIGVNLFRVVFKRNKFRAPCPLKTGQACVPEFTRPDLRLGRLKVTPVAPDLIMARISRCPPDTQPETELATASRLVDQGFNVVNAIQYFNFHEQGAFSGEKPYIVLFRDHCGPRRN